MLDVYLLSRLYSGSTLHSFAGIGLGKEKVEVLASRIAGSFVARQRWRAVDCLIVDESKFVLALILCG